VASCVRSPTDVLKANRGVASAPFIYAIRLTRVYRAQENSVRVANGALVKRVAGIERGEKSVSVYYTKIYGPDELSVGKGGCECEVTTYDCSGEGRAP
jgi:hypothetical protein